VSVAQLRALGHPENPLKAIRAMISPFRLPQYQNPNSNSAMSTAT
jgi:hypothetical protein